MQAAHKALMESLPKLPQGSDEEQACLGALKALADMETDVAPGLLATEAQAMSGAVQGAPGMAPGGAPMGGPGPMPV
jgi:hypothetical protein